MVDESHSVIKESSDILRHSIWLLNEHGGDPEEAIQAGLELIGSCVLSQYMEASKEWRAQWLESTLAQVSLIPDALEAKQYEPGLSGDRLTPGIAY